MVLAIRAGRSHRHFAFALAASLLAAGASARAEETTEPAAESPEQADAERFCANIGDAARDARFAWEARTLAELKSEIEAKTAALETKRAELEDWIARREAFRKLAEQNVVDIYAKMRPDAAASQLASLDPETAAAIVASLNSRTASAVLAEMDTRRAASLAALIAGSGEPEQQPIVASQ